MSSSLDDVLARARGVRLAIFDVDGVMTDGTLYIGPSGEALKAFNILDGHGVKMLQAAGVATAILSGRESEAVSYRARELSIAYVVQGAGDKVAAFERLRKDAGVESAACAFVGDVMTSNPRTIAPEKLAAEAAQVMQTYRIGGRIVVASPDGKLLGVVTFNDLLAAGVV